MELWQTIDKLATWIGWAPIALVEIIFMVAAKFFYDRELANKDTTTHRLEFEIQHLNQELENSKQYRVDVMVKTLTERVKLSNKMFEELSSEKESEQRQRKLIEQEKGNVLKELDIARSDILALREQLKSYENDLDDLMDDFCEICEPDDEHPGANFIDWQSSMYKIEDNIELVDKVGCCNYCTSPQIQCKVCGEITSLYIDSREETECNGGCGVVYNVISYVEDKMLQHSIKVSRIGLESEDNHPF